MPILDQQYYQMPTQNIVQGSHVVERVSEGGHNSLWLFELW